MSLRVLGLTKYYGKSRACENVGFEMKEGTVTVLLGPNGAGKSTLIKAVIGFLRYVGEVTVDGIPNKTPEARRLVGYVPEIPALYPNLTVSEHMEFLARAYRLTDYKGTVDSLLERFELIGKSKKFGDELSKGMQQKLNLCLGLLPRPKYLLLDEPMIGLDPHAIKELKELIGEYRAGGGAVLVSTHMIDSVDMLWDNAIIMKEGQVVGTFTKKDLEGEGKTLEEIFFALTETTAEQMAADAEPEESEE